MISYEEKPRDKWLLDFPAQAALTASQIWWSTEVRNCPESKQIPFQSSTGKNGF